MNIILAIMLLSTIKKGYRKMFINVNSSKLCPSEVSMYHYELCNNILRVLEINEDSVGELLGIGEDDFMAQMWPISVYMAEGVDLAYNRLRYIHEQFNGTACYEVPPLVADVIYRHMTLTGDLPSLEELEQHILAAILSFSVRRDAHADGGGNIILSLFKNKIDGIVDLTATFSIKEGTPTQMHFLSVGLEEEKQFASNRINVDYRSAKHALDQLNLSRFSILPSFKKTTVFEVYNTASKAAAIVGWYFSPTLFQKLQSEPKRLIEMQQFITDTPPDTEFLHTNNHTGRHNKDGSVIVYDNGQYIHEFSSIEDYAQLHFLNVGSPVRTLAHVGDRNDDGSITWLGNVYDESDIDPDEDGSCVYVDTGAIPF